MSPRTLVALLQKADLLLPAAGTLTLIPEPDGVLPEDFTIPPAWQGWAKVLR